MKYKLLFVSLSLFISGACCAGTEINGFASIKGGMTLGSDESLYGYDDSIDFQSESLAALQLKSDLGEKLSFTSQILSRGSENWEADFEWAFLSYDLSEKTRLNAGRLRTPFYKYSDYLDVGYAYDWSRVPKSIYGSGLNNIEGIALLHNSIVGSYDSTVQLTLGSIKESIGTDSNRVDGSVDNVVATSIELSRDNHSLRLAYLRGDATLVNESFDGFTAALHQLSLHSLANKLDVLDDAAWFVGLGFNYEKDNWVVVSEITQSDIKDSYTGKSLSSYLSVGRRFDKVFPFISVERSDTKAKPEIYEGLDSSLPIYEGVLSLVDSQGAEINSVNIGVRYDFHSSAAFKAQFTNADNTTIGHKDSVVVVGVDIVF